MKTYFLLASLLSCAGCYVSQENIMMQTYSRPFTCVMAILIIGWGIKWICQDFYLAGGVICFAGAVWFLLA
jgi:hypothetical protein